MVSLAQPFIRGMQVSDLPPPLCSFFAVFPTFLILAAQQTQPIQGKIGNHEESILSTVCLIVHHWLSPSFLGYCCQGLLANIKFEAGYF